MANLNLRKIGALLTEEAENRGELSAYAAHTKGIRDRNKNIRDYRKSIETETGLKIGLSTKIRAEATTRGIERSGLAPSKYKHDAARLIQRIENGKIDKIANATKYASAIPAEYRPTATQIAASFEARAASLATTDAKPAAPVHYGPENQTDADAKPADASQN